MYIFVNRGLKMSHGKMAAQASHAAVEAFRISDESLIKRWYHGGHYTKLVMQAENEDQLSNIERYLNDRGFKTALIIDEGRTEIKPFTKTALGVEIVNKDDLHTAETFGEFRTFKPVSDAKRTVTAKNGLHAIWLILKESLAHPRSTTRIQKL